MSNGQSRSLELNLENIESHILELERQLSSEKTSFGRRKLVDKIKELKKEYNANRQPITIQCCERKGIELLIDDSKGTANGQKQIVEGYKNKSFHLEDFVVAVIRKCLGCKFEHFSCKTSIYLENLYECDVSCSAQQIRITGCKRLRLKCFSHTGVFLQDSTDIEIGEYKDNNLNKALVNKFRCVYDFSSPLGSKNYIIKD